MKATLKDGRVIQVRIQHNHVDTKNLTKEQLIITPKAFTEAKISIDGVEYFGKAMCNRVDQFKRRKGVQVSLSRALSEAGISRADRSIVWGRIWCGRFN